MNEKIIHRAETRGFADHGWLKAAHSFSFAGYFNRNRMNFGALRVLNDDLISAGMGFSTHPHKTMEIITIPLRGALRHKDSTGMEGVIRAGDVQVMSAGTGISHSEFNHSQTEELSLLQIWVIPNKEGTPPRYQQAAFGEDGRQNRFQSIASGFGTEGSLEILQKGEISLAHLEAGKTLTYQRKDPANGVYIFTVEGGVNVDGETLVRRDAIGIEQPGDIAISAAQASQLVVLEVPLQF